MPRPTGMLSPSTSCTPSPPSLSLAFLSASASSSVARSASATSKSSAMGLRGWSRSSRLGRRPYRFATRSTSRAVGLSRKLRQSSLLGLLLRVALDHALQKPEEQHLVVVGDVPRIDLPGGEALGIHAGLG